MSIRCEICGQGPLRGGVSVYRAKDGGAWRCIVHADTLPNAEVREVVEAIEDYFADATPPKRGQDDE